MTLTEMCKKFSDLGEDPFFPEFSQKFPESMIIYSLTSSVEIIHRHLGGTKKEIKLLVSEYKQRRYVKSAMAFVRNKGTDRLYPLSYEKYIEICLKCVSRKQKNILAKRKLGMPVFTKIDIDKYAYNFNKIRHLTRYVEKRLIFNISRGSILFRTEGWVEK